MSLRSPVLIAETPFAGGQGPRFLAPPNRQVDADVASYYIGRVREVEADVEEIEGDDHLAVTRPRTDDATGTTGHETMVLAGIDVDRLSGDERDEILDQLRERLDVLGDALAAVDWEAAGPTMVVEIPELDEWHEPSWDALPRTGPWADPDAEEEAANRDDDPIEEPSASHEEEPAPVEEPVAEEPVEDPAPVEEPVAEEPAPEPEPVEEPIAERQEEPVAEHREEIPVEPAPPERVYLDIPFPKAEREPAAPVPVTVIVQMLAPKAETETPEPTPDVIVPAREPEPLPPPPAPKIDPASVAASVDQSTSLALTPPAPQQMSTIEPPAPPRRKRWMLWVPWTATAALTFGAGMYLSAVDRTWNQRIRETQFVVGATKVVETPGAETIVEKPVDRIVEKRVEVAVEKPVPVIVPVTVPAAATAKDERGEAWSRFESAYRARIAQRDLAAAADMLTGWSKHVKESPPTLPALKDEYRKSFPAWVGEWTAARVADRRFADGHAGLALLEMSAATSDGLIDKGAIARERVTLRAAEDQFHYTQIRTLANQEDVSPERLRQHIDAYLSLVEPPGVMLAEVQQLAAYRRWIKEGRPAKATVRIDWGTKATTRDHAVEVTLGSGPEAATFSRTAAGDPGKAWSDTFAVSGVPGHASRIPYRIKTTRKTSPVEELAEAAGERTELFLSEATGIAGATDSESGTKVTVEWSGLVSRPSLPPWNTKPPAVPVSLPK